ncbi:hypothetical protein HK100_007274 [Physocladia obscura]|uniref:Uncharacterized protein n=1 Tax=Physocladia obscura TaxID=109957 RepID=A0AAD5T6J7_9FUNG|nr:hypothetical protein HK100_007274 [Physocladia obscura]
MSYPQSGLHKRSTAKYSADTSSSSNDSGALFKSLKDFDSYAKPLEDFTLKTNTGALGIYRLLPSQYYRQRFYIITRSEYLNLQR